MPTTIDLNMLSTSPLSVVCGLVSPSCCIVLAAVAPPAGSIISAAADPPPVDVLSRQRDRPALPRAAGNRRRPRDDGGLARAGAGGGGRRHARAGGHPARELALPQRRRRRSPALVGELNARLADARGPDGHGEVPSKVRTGAEIALTQFADVEPAQLAKPEARRRRWLLVEPPFTPVAPNLDGLLLDVCSAAATRSCWPIRSAAPPFTATPRCSRDWCAAGILTSVTAGSFAGRFGAEARRLALESRARRAASQRGLRRPRYRPAAPRRSPVSSTLAGLAPLTQWLTEAVPAAILDGGEIPPRPELLCVASRRAPRRWLPLRR